jgi:hypothetical protein
MIRLSSARLLPIAAVALMAAAPSASAATSPKIVRTPIAAFTKSTKSPSSYTMTVVVRFDRALPTSGARVVIGPHVRRGQTLRQVFGGDTPHRMGNAAKHCYMIEVGRPAPVTTPRTGARWVVGVTSGGTISDTARATLHPFPTHRLFGPREAHELGC